MTISLNFKVPFIYLFTVQTILKFSVTVYAFLPHQTTDERLMRPSHLMLWMNYYDTYAFYEGNQNLDNYLIILAANTCIWIS